MRTTCRPGPIRANVYDHYQMSNIESWRTRWPAPKQKKMRTNYHFSNGDGDTTSPTYICHWSDTFLAPNKNKKDSTYFPTYYPPNLFNFCNNRFVILHYFFQWKKTEANLHKSDELAIRKVEHCMRQRRSNVDGHDMAMLPMRLCTKFGSWWLPILANSLWDYMKYLKPEPNLYSFLNCKSIYIQTIVLLFVFLLLF